MAMNRAPRTLGTLILLMAMVCVSAGSPVEAQPDGSSPDRLVDVRLGRLNLDPSVSQSVQYDDNILLEDEEDTPQSDLISRTAVGLALESPYLLDLKINHRTTMKNFSDSSGFDDVEHRTKGTAEYDFGSMALGLSGVRMETSEPLDLVFATRQELSRRSLFPFLRVGGPAGFTELTYQNTRFEYEAEPFSAFNYREETWELRSKYFVTRTGFWQGRIEAGQVEYDRDTIGDSLGVHNPFMEVTFGGGGNVNEAVRLKADVGVHARSDLQELFDRGDTTDDNPWSVATESLVYLPIGDASLIWSTPHHNLTASYLRSVGKSAFTEYMERDKFKVQYSRRFTRAWSGQTSVSYAMANESSDSVPEAKKERVRFQLQSTYRIRPWAPLTVLYTQENKITNDGTGEYAVRRVGLAATIRF